MAELLAVQVVRKMPLRESVMICCGGMPKATPTDVSNNCSFGMQPLTVEMQVELNGYSADGTFKMIAERSGCPVPDTPEQRSWVMELAPRRNLHL